MVGDDVGDAVGRNRPVRVKPVRRPVERAEKRARDNRGVGAAEVAGAHSRSHERADAALVAVAFGDDRHAKARRQRIHFQVRGRAFDFIDQTQDVRLRERAQAIRQRRARLPRRCQGVQEPVERPVLTEKEQFVLAAEVMVEIARRQVGCERDLAHPGGRETAAAEHASRRFQDRETAGLGATP